MAKEKRKDSNRSVLRVGESQRKNGTYQYSWTENKGGKRRFIYAKTLQELRNKEALIQRDKGDGIKAEGRFVTLNDIYRLWCELKRGLKDNTFQNYTYMYEAFVKEKIGREIIGKIRKSDIKRFYNNLLDQQGLRISTVDNIHTVLHQVLDMAVDDNYIRSNPSNNVLREMKKARVYQIEKRRALTRPEQELFMDYVKNSLVYRHWYPVFAVLLGTGMRIGELTGLRWCDIDLEEGFINITHTLVYYNHRDATHKHGCYYNMNTTKTENSERQIPMLDFVKEAFLEEKRNQDLIGLKCNAVIDGYTDFIFLNQYGKPHHHGGINKAIQRITRDCNDEQLNKNENAEVLLPHFTCHNLRHTFTTRMCEAGVNVKVIQDTLGHKDISTTLNIYTDVTKELKKSEFEGLDDFFKGDDTKKTE